MGLSESEPSTQEHTRGGIWILDSWNGAIPKAVAYTWDMFHYLGFLVASVGEKRLASQTLEVPGLGGYLEGFPPDQKRGGVDLEGSSDQDIK